jgi:hypothetical protein
VDLIEEGHVFGRHGSNRDFDVTLGRVVIDSPTAMRRVETKATSQQHGQGSQVSQFDVAALPDAGHDFSNELCSISTTRITSMY